MNIGKSKGTRALTLVLPILGRSVSHISKMVIFCWPFISIFVDFSTRSLVSVSHQCRDLNGFCKQRASGIQQSLLYLGGTLLSCWYHTKEGVLACQGHSAKSWESVFLVEKKLKMLIFSFHSWGCAPLVSGSRNSTIANIVNVSLISYR